MKARIAVWLVLLSCAGATISWGVCPEDTLDRGECDTMYVEPWPADTVLQGDPPYFVRVPIFVTNDLADVWDSICGFTIPLCYYHSNPSKYCSLTAHWNMFGTMYFMPWFSTRSIFRHIVEGADTLHHNRMADMARDFSGRDWDVILIDLDGTSYFRLYMSPYGSQDQFWWEGSKILLATMTFKLEDSMRVCIDTCFWPPSAQLSWSIQSEGGDEWITKIPRPGTTHGASFETCFNVVPYQNQPPNPFCLLFPPNKAFTPRVVPFDWETASDPDSPDPITYDLHVSTSRYFSPDSTEVDSGLVMSEHVKPLDYGAYYWKVKAKDDRGAETWSSQIGHFIVTGLHQSTTGDFNADGSIDAGDLVFAVNYLYRAGPPPDPSEAGDCNCDGTVNVGDVVHLVSYLFRGGPPPCEQ